MRIHASLKTRPQDAVPLVAGGIEAYLPLSGMVDIDAERSRMTKELGEVEAQVQRLEGLLAGPFAERAPAEVVAKERARLEGMQQSRLKLEAQLKSLG
jgi:valyl-tRNA synthetase